MTASQNKVVTRESFVRDNLTEISKIINTLAVRNVSAALKAIFFSFLWTAEERNTAWESITQRRAQLEIFTAFEKILLWHEKTKYAHLTNEEVSRCSEVITKLNKLKLS